MVLVACACALAVPSARAAPSPGPQQEESRDDESREEGSADTGRSFLFREVLLSGFYSSAGVPGLPPGDTTPDHFGLSPRPPGSYVAVDYVRTFTEASWLNRHLLPEWLSIAAMNLHPRVVLDALDTDTGLGRLEFAPQDFWVRFNVGNVDRLTLRIGQFVIPYGANPVLAPRQQFLLPIEATDLGLKWDWGIDLKGPLGEYDWEVAATLGAGEGLHAPRPFSGSPDSRFLLTGRLGTPTYRDAQYGVSFLYGNLPQLRGADIVSPTATRRWRVAADTFYKYGTYLVAGAQLSFGQNRLDAEDAAAGQGSGTAEVLGYRAWLDWVVPTHQDLRLGAQLESVIRDLGRPASDDSALILEVGYSVSTEMSLTLDYRIELHRTRPRSTEGLYLAMIWYGQ